MPPKAKNAKGKGGKEEKKPVEEPEPDEEEKELMERELVINYLKSKLGKYQSKGEALEDENSRLAKELDQSRLNLRDINEFLTNELKARSLTSAALEQKMMELEEEMQKMQDEFQEAAKRLVAEKDEEIKGLHDELELLRGKRKEVDMFLEQKATLEEKIANLERTVEDLKNQHATEISNLERKHVQDKDRWKKEMAQKIKETKAQMMKLTDNQLEVTTKRTIMENEQMSSELAYQSRQTERLMEKNSSLREEAADLRRQVELYKQTEGELAKRNHVYQKTIKTLLEKLKLQGTQRQSDEEQVQQLEEALGDLEERARHAEMAVGEKVHEVEMLTEELRKGQARLKELEDRYDDTAKFLTACLGDVKRKIVTITRSENENGQDQVQLQPGRLEELGLEQRELALTYLLERLHVYQATSGGMASMPASGVVFGSPRMATEGSQGKLGQAPVGGVALPPIVTPPQYQAQGMPLRGFSVPADAAKPSYSPAPPPSSDYWDAGSDQREGLEEGTAHTADAEMLMGKILADVRPWGQKTKDTVLTSKNKPGAFLRKGAGIHAGAVSSRVSYSQRFAA
mmetsp:Transcript_31038/g.73792  ORF Transcript_31038/g.73792 Transcript_31038/m.73792 type:complete len:572 (-) Transcript_31038:333-2048(-)